MIDKEKLIQFIDYCIQYQEKGSKINFLEIIKFKITDSKFGLFKPQETCRWEINKEVKRPQVSYISSCNYFHNSENYWNDDVEDFFYCPYCSKPIQVIENE